MVLLHARAKRYRFPAARVLVYLPLKNPAARPTQKCDPGIQSISSWRQRVLEPHYVLCFGCGSVGTVSPNLSLASATYATDAAPTNQPLVAFTRPDSSQCLGLEDATLHFSDAQSVDEVRRYLMPAVTGSQGLPGTQAIVVETNHLSYTYDAGSGILVLNRGAVSDTGRTSTANGANTLNLQEHFQTAADCRQAHPVLIVYHRS